MAQRGDVVHSGEGPNRVLGVVVRTETVGAFGRQLVFVDWSRAAVLQARMTTFGPIEDGGLTNG